jgi:hypothetical protein
MAGAGAAPVTPAPEISLGRLVQAMVSLHEASAATMTPQPMTVAPPEPAIAPSVHLQ